MSIVFAILIFSVIVIIHELGHFLLAKANGIEVFEFSLGMGPKLISKQMGETLYCIKLLPLGGSCMMGEDAEEEDGTGVLKGNFNEKSVWARMSVIAAGPIFNFLLAFLFSVILVAGAGYDKAVIGQVSENYPAEEAGLLPGDEIVKMNGHSIHLWREVSIYNQFHQGEGVEVTYKRDGEKHMVTVVPKQEEDTGRYVLGIYGSGKSKAGFIDSIKYGAYNVRYWIVTVIESLRFMVTGQVSLDDMAGPVGIVNVVGDTYKQSIPSGSYTVFLNMLNIAILLSANLGVMNLLPIPALDGGRLVFLLIEAVRRKRIPPEKEGIFHFVGFVLLMGLMLVIMFNDVRKIFM